MLLEISFLLLVVYFFVFYFENFGSKKRLPGPIRIPPFGNLIQVTLENKIGHVAFQQLAKKYGEIMSIKLGFSDAVIVSSYKAAKAIFTLEETQGRDCTGFFWDRSLKQNIGFAFSNDPVTVKTRKFCRDTLRKYGYGNREAMQNMFLDEFTEFSKYLQQESKSNSNHSVHFCSNYFDRPFLNIVCTLIMQKRFDYTDPQFQALLHYINIAKAGDSDIAGGRMVPYPFLRYVFPNAFGLKSSMNAIGGIHQYALNHLNERKKFFGKEPECFTDDFLQKMEEDKSKSVGIFTEDHFSLVFMDMIQGGTDTTASVTNFFILHLLSNAEIQEKVYKEIIQEIGPNRLPSLDHKQSMPYTHAVILEALRWSRAIVLGVPRKATANFAYGKHIIPKDTVLMYNLQSIFFDTDFWGDPHVFRPERFIDGGSKNIDNHKSDVIHLIFGAGRRGCFGEVFARDSLFIFTTSIIQKFKFSLPPGPSPSLEPGVAFTLYAQPYDAIVTVRD